MKVRILNFVAGPPSERVFDILDGLSHVFIKFVGNNRGRSEGYIPKIVGVTVLKQSQ